MILQILGAAGAGKSTLGTLMARQTGLPLLHADFYRRQDDQFEQMRPISVRRAMLAQDMACRPSFLLDGGLSSWLPEGLLQPDLLLLVRCPQKTRMERLAQRERNRYGQDCFSPLHPHFQLTQEFLEWAAGYEQYGLEETNSLVSHMALLARTPCPSLILWNNAPPETLLRQATAFLQML